MNESSKILVEGPIALEEIEVRWDGEEAPCPAAAQARIEERWRAYLADAGEQKLFNGPVTRFISLERGAEGRLILYLGPTDYKRFLATTLRDRAWFEAHAPEAITPALGNSVLLTCGGEALLGIRSPKTSAYANRAHPIGGVLDVLGTPMMPATVAGIVEHLRTEMREEAGIEGKDLLDGGWPRLLAVVEDPVLTQPELLWQWELRTGVRDICARLNLEEHTGGLVIEKAGINGGLFAQLTPAARAVWERWRQVEA